MRGFGCPAVFSNQASFSGLHTCLIAPCGSADGQVCAPKKRLDRPLIRSRTRTAGAILFMAYTNESSCHAPAAALIKVSLPEPARAREAAPSNNSCPAPAVLFRQVIV